MAKNYFSHIDLTYAGLVEKRSMKLVISTYAKFQLNST